MSVKAKRQMHCIFLFSLFDKGKHKFNWKYIFLPLNFHEYWKDNSPWMSLIPLQTGCYEQRMWLNRKKLWKLEKVYSSRERFGHVPFKTCHMGTKDTAFTICSRENLLLPHPRGSVDRPASL